MAAPDGSGTTGDLARPRQRAGLPLPLAIALGIAIGLVVAAAVLRMAAGDGQPLTVEVGDPASAAPADTTPVVPDGAAATAVDPGKLSLPGDDVVLRVGEVAALRLTNSGGTAIEWQAVSVPAWVQLTRLQGSVDPGATVELEVQHAPGLVEGDYAGEVTFGWDGLAPGVAAVRVVGAVERVPDLQNLQVGSRALVVEGCGQDQTEVAVFAEDETGLAQVVVTAMGPSTDTQTQVVLAADPSTPGRFLGVVGPFADAGQVRLEIEAVDVRTNRAVADGGQLSVAAC